MAGKRARFYIDADASGVARGARQAEQSLDRLHQSAKKSLGGARDVAAGFGLAMGATGVVGTLQGSLRAYQESEDATSRLSAQLKTLGLNTEGVKKQIDGAIQSQSKFGAFDDEDLTRSFVRILRSTKDVDQALRLNTLAMDIARGSGKGLAASAEAVAKAAGGNISPLKRMGLQLDKNATSQDALAAAQKAFGGQAEEFGKSSAAAADRASISWENAEEEIGRRLAPAFDVAAQKGADLAQEVGHVASSLGGLGPLAVGATTAVGVRGLGGGLSALVGSIQSVRRESQLLTRVKLGHFDVLDDLGKIDTRATTASIRSAYREIGTALTTSQAQAISRVERIAVPPSTFGKFTAAARTAGGNIVNALGGPLGVAAIAGGVLALGVAKWVEGLQSVEDKAKAVGDAIQHAIDLQASLADAKLGLKQAELDAQTAQRGRQFAGREVRQATSRRDAAVARVAQGPSGKFTDDMRRIPSVAKATNDLAAAEERYKQAALSGEQASLRLKAAHEKVAAGQREQAAASERVQQTVRTASNEARAQAHLEASDYNVRAEALGSFAQKFDESGTAAKRFAAIMRQGAAANKGLSDNARKTQLELATLAEKLHRVPNQTEAKIVSDAVAKGEDVGHLTDLLGRVPEDTTASIDTNAADAADKVATLLQNLAALHDRNITITTNYVTKGATGDVAARAATGAYVGGPAGAGDSVPVWVSPAEVILNPNQQAIAGRDNIMRALSVTGAPTIGGAWRGYAKGGKPETPAEKRQALEDRWQNRLDSGRVGFDTEWARLDMLAAKAEGTKTLRDDRLIRHKQIVLLRGRVGGLRRLLREHPPAGARRDIYSEIADDTRQLRDLAQPIVADNAAGTTDADKAAARIAQLEAQLDQAKQRTASARLAAQLNAQALGVFSAAGDLGLGNGGPTINISSVLPPTPRQLVDLAALTTTALGGQANRRSGRVIIAGGRRVR